MNLSHLKKLLFVLGACLFPLAHAADKLVFVTSWFAEAEHGGFYQALAEGSYESFTYTI